MPTVDSPFDSLLDATLRSSPYLCRRDVQVQSHQGHVVLRGVVGSYYQKQMAQEIVRHIAGVDRIENQLEVNWT